MTGLRKSGSTADEGDQLGSNWDGVTYGFYCEAPGHYMLINYGTENSYATNNDDGASSDLTQHTTNSGYWVNDVFSVEQDLSASTATIVVRHNHSHKTHTIVKQPLALERAANAHWTTDIACFRLRS